MFEAARTWSPNVSSLVVYQANTGFSVSFFWPSSTNVKGGTMGSQQKPRNRRRHRTRAPSIPKTDVPSRACDPSPAQGFQNSCFANTSPINAHQYPSPPTTVLSVPSEYSNITDSAASLDISSSSSVSSCHDTEAKASLSLPLLSQTQWLDCGQSQEEIQRA